MNLAVISGVLSSAPRIRNLASGDRVVSLDVTTRDADGVAASVPVAVFDPPASVGRLEEGDQLVVVGSVRRRFFRAGGLTQSRTELVAQRIVPRRHTVRCEKAIATAREVLDQVG